MATRPNINLSAGDDNDVYALLNAQSGQPTVTVGEALRIQNKGSTNVYIHEGSEVFEVNGGTTLPTDWQIDTSDSPTGVIATCINDGVINVEVI